jgi:hypothetical protein
MAETSGAGKPRKARELTPPAPAALPFALLVTLWGCVGLAWQVISNGNLWIAAWLPVVGVLLLLRVLRKRRRTRDFAHAVLETQPDPVVAGRAFRVRVLLPGGATSGPPLVLRVVQRRVDHSHSSPDSELEWEQARTVTQLPLPDGRHRVEGDFLLPADAPPSGVYRDQLHVQWRVQLIDGQGLARLSLELPVRADPAATTVQALGEAMFAEKPLDELPTGQVQVVPAWVEQEDARGVTWHFKRPRMRALAAAAAIAAVAVALAIDGSRRAGGASWRLHEEERLLFGLLAVLVLQVLHAATARWRLRVDDDGLSIDRSSWLWPRHRHLGALPLDQVTRMTVATGGRDGGDRPWFRLVAGPRDGVRHWLTPALRGPGLVQDLARRLRHAFGHRGARFAPGSSPPRPAPWPWVLAGALWGGWAATVAAVLTRWG